MKRLLLILFIFVLAEPISADIVRASTNSIPSSLDASKSAGSTERLRECVDKSFEVNGGPPSTDILFLIDASSSLVKTDEFGRRFKGIKSVVKTLQSDSREDKEQVRGRTRLQFLQFGSFVRPLFEGSDAWLDINDVPEIPEAFKPDPDTDYVGALLSSSGGALKALSESDADCKVLLWFTDGQFDIDDDYNTPRTFEWLREELEDSDGTIFNQVDARRAEQLGEELLCSSRSRESIADQLRSITGSTGFGLTLIGLGLGAGQGFDDRLLQRIVVNPDGDCGEKPTVGSVISVRNAESLALEMRQALFNGVEIDAQCSDNVRDLVDSSVLELRDALEYVDIFVQLDPKKTDRVLLRRDDGAEIELWNDQLRPRREAFGMTVDSQMILAKPKITFQTALRLNSSVPDWRGRWTLQACTGSGSAPSGIYADVVARGCVAIDLAEESKQLFIGRSRNIKLIMTTCRTGARREFLDQDGVDLTARLLVEGSEKLSEVSLDADGLIVLPYTPKLSNSELSAAKPSTRLIEVVEVEATYRVFGEETIRLDVPKKRDVLKFLIRPLPKSPIVEFSNQKRPCTDVEKGAKKRRAICEITLTADSIEAGSVKFGQPTIDSTRSVGEVDWRILEPGTGEQKDLFTVEPGATKKVLVEFSLAAPQRNTAIESVAARLPVTSSSENGSPPENSALTPRFEVEPDFQVKPDIGNVALWSAGFLLVSLTLLGLLKWSNLRLRLGDKLFVTVIPLDSLKSDSIAKALTSKFESSPVTAESGRDLPASRIPQKSGIAIAAKFGKNPFNTIGFSEITHPTRLVVGPEGHNPKNGSGRGSLAVNALWCLTVDKPTVGLKESNEQRVREMLIGNKGDLVIFSRGALSAEGLKRRRSRIESGVESATRSMTQGLLESAQRRAEKEDIGSGKEGTKDASQRPSSVFDAPRSERKRKAPPL